MSQQDKMVLKQKQALLAKEKDLEKREAELKQRELESKLRILKQHRDGTFAAPNPHELEELKRRLAEKKGARPPAKPSAAPGDRRNERQTGGGRP